MRPWGGGRPTLRDPTHPGWPHDGERTEIREVAEAWARQYVASVHDTQRARVIGPRRAKRLAAVTDAYLEHRRVTMEHRTFLSDQTAIRHLLDFCPATATTHDIDAQAFANHLAGQGYAPATVKQYATNSLRPFFAWLGVPWQEVDIKNPGGDDREAWTDEQVKALRSAAKALSPEHLLALDLGLFVGLRQAEIFGAEWEDFNGATMRVRRQLPMDRTTTKPLKGKEARTAVVLPGWAHKLGTGRILPQPTQAARRGLINDTLDATGLNEMGVGWHMARHTYARKFLELKPEMELLRSSLGHKSVRTTEQYYRHWIGDRNAEIALAAMRGKKVLAFR